MFVNINDTLPNEINSYLSLFSTLHYLQMRTTVITSHASKTLNMTMPISGFLTVISGNEK